MVTESPICWNMPWPRTRIPRNTGPSLHGAVNAQHFQLQFNRNVGATNLTYIAQTTGRPGGPWTNLMSYSVASGWTAEISGATWAESVPASLPPDQFVVTTITDPAAVGSAGSITRFYRLAVHP